MANMMDYLAFRGDIPFEADPFNDVDNQLCAQFSFMDLQKIVPEEAGKEVELMTAVSAYFDGNRGSELSLGALIPTTIFDLAREMSEAPRFLRTRLTAYRYELAEGSVNEQWSALTFLFEDNSLYIAFAGTDDTIASWKENMDMALTDEIPSQSAAVRYVNEVAAAYPTYKLRIGGHSKGGNLALYSSAKCDPAVRARIVTVYDNDGPGFSKSFLEDAGYREVRDRVRNLLPEQSFVGLLLHRDLTPIVVKSDGKGLLQHDSFTWQVRRNSFILSDGLDGEALVIAGAVARWVSEMSDEETRTFVEAVYKVLVGTNSRTLTELSENKTALFASYRKLTKEERASLRGAVKSIVRGGASAYGEMLPGGLRGSAKGAKDGKDGKAAGAQKKPQPVVFVDGSKIYDTKKPAKQRKKQN